MTDILQSATNVVEESTGIYTSIKDLPQQGVSFINNFVEDMFGASKFAPWMIAGILAFWIHRKYDMHWSISGLIGLAIALALKNLGVG